MKATNSIRFASSRMTCAGACTCTLILMAWGISPRAQEHGHLATAAQSADARTSALVPQKLPPLPAGVSELRFSDFFVTPIGPRGLELTKTLCQLDGKKVRVLGYMARQELPVPGMFLFNAIPVRLNEEHYGLAEDLPAATLFVSVPKDRDRVVRHTPELMLLTGTLSLGNREEADGRISAVRLALDPPEARGSFR